VFHKGASRGEDGDTLTPGSLSVHESTGPAVERDADACSRVRDVFFEAMAFG